MYEVLREKSHFNWGRDEALRRTHNTAIQKVEVVECFISWLKYCSIQNPKTSYMFSAAQNGAESVLDDLIKERSK